MNRGPFRFIVPSPSGRFLALLTTSSELWVTSLDFSRSLSEFSLLDEAPGEPSPIRKIEWCGSNSVVVAWERTVVMVGPFGETLKYFYTDPVELIGEVDGTRILSSETCDFLQIVPREFDSNMPRPSYVLTRSLSRMNRIIPINILTGFDISRFDSLRSVSTIQSKITQSRRIHQIDQRRSTYGGRWMYRCS